MHGWTFFYLFFLIWISVPSSNNSKIASRCFSNSYYVNFAQLHYRSTEFCEWKLTVCSCLDYVFNYNWFKDLSSWFHQPVSASSLDRNLLAEPPTNPLNHFYSRSFKSKKFQISSRHKVHFKLTKRYFWPGFPRHCVITEKPHI